MKTGQKDWWILGLGFDDDEMLLKLIDIMADT